MGAPDRTRFPWTGLTMLAVASFVSVTTEFLPTGLLPDIAVGLHVSESQVGILVTVFAGTVVLTGTPLTYLTRRYSRKRLILVVLGVFALSNVLAAVAPSYAMLTTARVIGGLAHGLFWAVVGAYAAHLVPRHQLPRAIAVTGSGPTIAFVLGVPAGTALGHLVGWRAAFAVVAALLLVLGLLVARLLPPVQHEPRLVTGEIPLPARRDPTLRSVLVLCGAVLLVTIAHYAFYTYIAPALLADGVTGAGVGGVLFLYGAAGAIGLVVAGVVSGRFPRSSLAVMLAVSIASVVAIVAGGRSTPVLLVAMMAWGAAFGGIAPLFQTTAMRVASARIRDLSASLLASSFNVGIGGGALLGGLLLDAWSIDALPWFDVVVMAAALVGIGGAGALALAARARRAPSPRTGQLPTLSDPGGNG